MHAVRGDFNNVCVLVLMCWAIVPHSWHVHRFEPVLPVRGAQVTTQSSTKTNLCDTDITGLASQQEAHFGQHTTAV
jgi:hypothetical protein